MESTPGVESLGYGFQGQNLGVGARPMDFRLEMPRPALRQLAAVAKRGRHPPDGYAAHPR